MDIIIFRSNEFSKNYMPFTLYKQILCKILVNNNIGKNISFIDNITLLEKKKEKQIVIMNIYCLQQAMNNPGIFDILKNINSYIILINTEFFNWAGYNLNPILNTINTVNNASSIFYFFEYNNLNYNYVKNNYLNIKLIFIPMCYDEQLENFYSSNLVKQIEWKDKDIDILFYGTNNDRRNNIINELRKHYPAKNIVNFNVVSNKDLCNYIERSKIVINILYYQDNVIFDYYRNSFLISNKVLLISEYPKYIDYSIEIGLENVDENLIFSTYENFVNTVGKYLIKDENEIKRIIDKQYNWFKENNNMNNSILKNIESGDLVFEIMPPRNISLFKVFMSPDVIQPLNDVVMSGFITQGPQVEKFEKNLSEYFSNPYVLTLNSATSGLTLALRLLLESDPGEQWPGFDRETDYVLSPALTCFATNAAILANGCKIKWVDTDNTTANVSLTDIKNKLNIHTKVLYIVHWGGYPVDLAGLKELQDEHYVKYGYKFRIVEDCAHAFGATYKNKKLGSHGNICVFSLQAIKHLTTGDGGLILLPTEKLYERGKLIRWFGIDRDKRNYNMKDFRMENDISEWGYKFHMNDINATLGIHNLPHIDGLLSKNRNNYQYLYNGLQCIEDITLFENNPDRKTGGWLFTMRVKRKTAFIDKMKEHGIATSQVHNRNDLNSCVKEFCCDLPGITELEKELICIPVGWWLEKDDLDYMIYKIKRGW